MKIVFAGLGSIGQRHLRNLKSLYPERLELAALRDSPNGTLIYPDMTVEQDRDLAEYYGLSILRSMEDVLAWEPDSAFITNPSSLHVSTALPLARAGVHLFIEKPLSHDLTGVAELQSVCETKKLKVWVGYQNRFHPFVAKTSEWLKKNSEHGVSEAEFCWKTYLPHHHPYENYRQSYAARMDLGGGVVLCLIHELDLIYYFFGLPESVTAEEGQGGSLGISVEEEVSAVLDYPNGLSVRLKLSFNQEGEEHGFYLSGTETSLKVDFVRNEMLQGGIAPKTESLRDFERNSLFIEEVGRFIRSIEDDELPKVSLQDGFASLKMALAIKKAFRDGRRVMLKEIG